MAKISQYTQAIKAKLNDLFAIAQDDDGTRSTKSVTVSQIGDAIMTEETFTGLGGQTPETAIKNNKTAIGDLSTLTTTEKSSLVGAVNEVNSKEEYKVRVSQMSLPNTVTLTANTSVQVLNNVDIRTLAYSSLDDIRNMTGTLVAAGFMWCSGGGAQCPDMLVYNGVVTMYLLSTYTKDISAIRLWTIWRD